MAHILRNTGCTHWSKAVGQIFGSVSKRLHNLHPKGQWKLCLAHQLRHILPVSERVRVGSCKCQCSDLSTEHSIRCDVGPYFDTRGPSAAWHVSSLEVSETKSGSLVVCHTPAFTVHTSMPFCTGLLQSLLPRWMEDIPGQIYFGVGQEPSLRTSRLIHQILLAASCT